jgi:hypothetical protein
MLNCFCYQNAKLKCGAQPKMVFSLPVSISIIQQYMTVPNPITENPQIQTPTKNSSYIGAKALRVPNIDVARIKPSIVGTRPNLFQF